MTFLITEAQDSNSKRDGYAVTTNSLAQAKRIASRRQVFQGTTLVVRYPGGEVASVKTDGGKWQDSQDED